MDANQTQYNLAQYQRPVVIRRALRSSVIAFAVATMANAAACKSDKNDNAKKVTVASTTDATEPVVDEDYRFRLDWPGRGWKLMREDDIRKLSPDAIAGAMHPDTRAYGAIVVEPFAGSDPKEMAELIVESRSLEDADVGPMQPMTLAGKRAVRFEMAWRTRGIALHMDTIVFLHQGYAYQLVAWSVTGEHTSTLDDFFESFSLTDGKVVGRTAKSVTSAQGVGWRVTEGVFESAIAGVRVRPKHEFRLMVGEELALVNPDAEVGLTRSVPHEVYGQLIFEPAPGAGHSEAYIERAKQNFLASFEATRVGAKKASKIGNTEVLFDLARSDDVIERNIYYGVFVTNGMLAQIAFWSLSGTEDTLWSSVLQALETIEIMAPVETDALERELLFARDPQNSVTATTSLRNGTFRDFAGGWSWTRPAGFWHLRTGQAARAVDPDASLYLEEPTRGVYGTIVNASTDGLMPDDYHKKVLDELELSPERITHRVIAGADARTSLISEVDPDDGTEASYYMTTITHGDRAVIVSLWGNADDIQADELAPVVDRVMFHETPLAPTERNRGHYRDVRMGYSVRLPDNTGTFRDDTPAPLTEFGSIATWRDGESKLVIIALNAMSVDQDTQWFTDFVEQMFQERLSALARQTPSRTETTLAGRPARQVLWGSGRNELRLLITSTDSTFYALMLFGGEQQLDVRSAFAFID